MLGLLTASFLIGVGLFQVPGGILAAIQGPRRTAIYGIIIASSAALLCGLSSQLQQMEMLEIIDPGIGIKKVILTNGNINSEMQQAEGDKWDALYKVTLPNDSRLSCQIPITFSNWHTIII